MSILWKQEIRYQIGGHIVSFFLGNMALIYNPNIVMDILAGDQAVVVFSFDEDNDNPQLDPERNNRIVLGTMLLPPVDAMWSLASGDLEKFQQEYYQHLTSPEVSEFIFMIIGMVYKGYKIIFYYPDDSSEVIQYINAFFLNNLGIHICEPSKQYDLFSYDNGKIPMYACGIYYAGIISPNEFLMIYPIDIPIPNNIYPKLIYDLHPFGNDMPEQIKMIDSLHKSIYTKRNMSMEIPFIM